MTKARYPKKFDVDMGQVFEALARGSTVTELAEERYKVGRSTLYAHIQQYAESVGARTITQAVVAYDRKRRTKSA